MRSSELDRLNAALDDRDDLLKSVTWLNSAKVAQLARAGAESNPEQYASRLRREKRLFGVRYKGENLYPEFQFQQGGDVHPAIERPLEILPVTGANWTAAFWLFQPHGRFGGKSPAEVFQKRSSEVVESAREDFVTGPYEGSVDVTVSPRKERR